MTSTALRTSASSAFLIACFMFIVPALTIAGPTMPAVLSPSIHDDVQLDLPGKEAGPFMENRGQWDDGILFAARTSFGHMAFGRDFIIFDVKEGMVGPLEKGLDPDVSMSRGTVIRMGLEGTNRVRPVGVEPSTTRTNILHGKDPSRWGIGIGSYGSIIYRDIWDGIDLAVGPKDGHVKYEFIVEPYANIGQIRFSMTGMSSIDVAPDAIRMVTPHGSELFDRDLVSFYRDSPGCVIGSSFVRFSDGLIGISTVGRDPSRTLVIDPVIYSTYIGGTDSEEVIDMVMGDDGACYIAGCTYSFDLLTTPGAYCDYSMGEKEGYVMKIYANGSAPEFLTYIGGSWSDHLTSLDVDGSGNIYVAGSTTSADYPTTKGAFNETQYGFQEDLFVSKLDPTGSSLIYSTYIGGNGSEAMDNRGNILVDGEGHVHLVGTSWSGNFPVTDDAYDKVNKEVWQDDHYVIKAKVVLVKLSTDGSDLEYSTYIGGEEWDTALGIDMDDEGLVYITGQTTSFEFPLTPGAFDTSFDHWSAIFVLKFDIARSYLVYSTLIEGSNYQVVKDILVDDEGHAFVVGETGSFDFPVMQEAYQKELNGWADIFVTALDQTGSSLHISTFLGGCDGENGNAIDMDPDGNIYVTGMTFSGDYPMKVVNKDDPSDRDPDMVISQLDSEGKELLQSTVLGGRSSTGGYPEDKGMVISYLSPRRVMVSGMTATTDLPITDDAWDGTMVDSVDHFLMEFDISLPPSAPRELSIERGDGFLNLSWVAPETDGGMPIDGYCIFKGTSEDELKQLKLLVGGLFYNDTELSMGSRYFYMVAAQNGVGQGLPSDIVSSGAASVPTPPQFFRLVKGDGTASLTWEPPVSDGASILEGYRVYRWCDGSGPAVIELDPFAFRYEDEDVSNGGNYSYEMTAWNMIGESVPTSRLWTIPSGRPSAPIGPMVENGTSSITISWDEPEDDGGAPVLFYRVHIGTLVGSLQVWRYAESYSKSFVDDLVEIGSEYEYYVTAFNSEGESPPSVKVKGLPQSVPSPPRDIKATEGNGFVHLSWDEPSLLGGIGLRGYRVHRAIDDGEPAIIAEVAFDNPSYNDKEVTNGIRYTYTVTAFNDCGPSMASDEVHATPAGVPGAPTALSARMENVTMVLGWVSPVNDGGAQVTEHRIFRGAAGSELEQIGSVPSGANAYIDTGISPGGTYTYALKAVNRMGASIYSEKVTAVALVVPGQPIDLVLTPGDGKVELSWKEPAYSGGSPITAYTVERTESGTEVGRTVAELGPAARSYRDEDVKNGKSYRYAVVAVNELGPSALEWSGPVMPAGRPGTPLSLMVTKDGDTVSIAWLPPQDDGGSAITFYRIYRSLEGGPMVLIGIVEAGMSAYSDNSPKEEGSYTYMVAAVNGYGESMTGAQGSIDVEADGGNGNIFADNIGLLITLPIIAVLVIVLVVVLIRKGKGEGRSGPVPLPSPVMDGSEQAYGWPEQENITVFERSMDNEQ